MEQTFAAYGRAIIVAGTVPVLLVALLMFALLAVVGITPATVVPNITLTLQELVVTVLVGAGLIGALLIALNKPIIHFFEGAFPFQRRWFLKWALDRNLGRHEALYQALLSRREMYQSATTVRGSTDASEPSDSVRQANSAALAVDEAYRRLEATGYGDHLPLERSLVTPTALGNAYAVMEEYPYQRYGIDPMVFWPRLLAVLPEGYRNSIGEQKTTCDFLLNLSLLLWLLALAASGLLVAGLAGQHDRPLFAGGAAVLAAAAAYTFYRATVTETRVLGKLINGAFDLYRSRLLEQLGFMVPEGLVEEQALWRELAAFIRRGESFYYPDEARAPETRAETATARRQTD